jgi:hypothetical protein
MRADFTKAFRLSRPDLTAARTLLLARGELAGHSD